MYVHSVYTTSIEGIVDLQHWPSFCIQTIKCIKIAISKSPKYAWYWGAMRAVKNALIGIFIGVGGHGECHSASFFPSKHFEKKAHRHSWLGSGSGGKL